MIPAVAQLPEVAVFYCERCGEIETRERARAAAADSEVKPSAIPG
jgi:hypothetical protein